MIHRDLVDRWVQRLPAVARGVDSAMSERSTGVFGAMHEIRSINSTIRTVMERVCLRQSPDSPDSAEPDLVRAWKASELISNQMDALDILSNPRIVQARPRCPITFFKLIDKVVRLYRPRAQQKGTTFKLEGRSHADVLYDPRTLHIIPSVYLDNAIKYSSHGGAVTVRVEEDLSSGEPWVGFEVTSHGPSATDDERLGFFNRRCRGGRARTKAEGSGLGLFMAKIVADQHGGCCSAFGNDLSANRTEWHFRFRMPIHKDPKT